MDNNMNSDLLISDKETNGFPATEERTEGSVKFRKPRSTKRNKIILICLLCVLGVAIIVGAVFGCIAIFGKKPYDNTADFYFSSDLLSEEGSEYTVYGKIEFNVCNYADSLRTSAENIDNYTVSIESDGHDITDSCNIHKEMSALAKGSRATSKVTIDVPDEYCNLPLDITVKSEPVSVILKGAFTVLPVWDSKFADEEGSVVATLTLSANHETTLLVKWDAEKLIADSTNAYVKASDESDECEVTLAAGTSTEIYFFKPDMNAVYDEDDKNFPIEIKKLKTEISESDDSSDSESSGNNQ